MWNIWQKEREEVKSVAIVLVNNTLLAISVIDKVQLRPKYM